MHSLSLNDTATLCGELYSSIDQSSSGNDINDSISPTKFVECESILLNLNLSNITTEAQLLPLGLRTAATVACVFVMIFGIAGNILVPFVVCRTKELCNSTNLFLINLSIADLLVIVVCMPIVLIELHSLPEIWTFGEVMCKAVPFVEMIVAHSSILTISAISFERYYAICKPLKAGYKCTKMRAMIIIALVWTIAIIATSPMLLITELSYAEYVDGSVQPVCLSQVENSIVQGYFLLIFATFFVFPFLILVILYGMIAKHLVMDSRMVCSTSEQYQMRLRRQVVYMLAAVMINFFICLLPFRIFSVWITLTSQEKVRELGMEGYYNLLYFCRIMLYINSAANPILYNICSSNFRRAFCHALGIRRLRNHFVRRGTSVHTSMTVGSSSVKSRTKAANNNNYNGGCNSMGVCINEQIGYGHNQMANEKGPHFEKMVGTMITINSNGHMV